MDSFLINKALLFTAYHFNKSNHNHGKPVYLHCLNVAYKAKSLGYGETVILGSIMHDLLEDTLCTYEEIGNNFGNNVADLVLALSYNTEIKDKLLKSIDTIDRSKQFGKDALLIKCLDVADNIPYFSLTDSETQNYLKLKCRYLMKICLESIPNEPAFLYLNEKIKVEKIF